MAGAQEPALGSCHQAQPCAHAESWRTLDPAWAWGALNRTPYRHVLSYQLQCHWAKPGAENRWRRKRSQTLRMKLHSLETEPELQVLEAIPQAPSSWPEQSVAGGREGAMEAGLLPGV